ncbi:hypothetical protein H310_07761 [Aphanomyces invadans]|uniref:Uncharacterized protein n=1 Tax=Aphanomyces invadans TaxID=157072 RepID=A0A024U248_9STRA|nr:hypothetical protein H310_07761 [Aphanomyces invadans]ETV99697.1 hypothetical protein H310_07761 [Aphanomyces invadans]|eukprot:XP_008871473.1 hypothetical protein H310_07761 [Aphanomyces invadans]
MPLEMRPSDNNDGNDNAVIPVEISESVGSYTAKLMDDAAIQSLRRELRAYEASIAQDGHMKEFVATKPTKVSRIELRQLLPCRSNNDDDAVAIEHPTAPSTVDGTPVARPLRPHRNSVIRRRDSFATAMVKHHLGFDPLMQTDDESSDKHRAEESTITPRRPASAITSHNHKAALPTKPASRSRPATVNVSSGAARQRPFAQVHKEEKVALQALEAQYSAAKDMVLRHMDRWGVRTRPDGDISSSVFSKLNKFDEKLGFQHPEDTDNRKSPRPHRPPPQLTSHSALPHMTTGSRPHHRQPPYK